MRHTYDEIVQGLEWDLYHCDTLGEELFWQDVLHIIHKAQAEGLFEERE